MRPSRIILVAVSVILSGILPLPAAPKSDDPDKDPAMDALLQKARDLIDAKKQSAAIEKCDQVIARFQKQYAKRKEQVYCARSQAETLGYLMKAAAEINKGTSVKGSAIAISATWSNAHFMKAYALLDLNRNAEAKASLKQAIELSPWNAQYLCELGHIYQMEKDWANARKTFELAEDQAAISPDDVKVAELGQARRGLGYVLVELGQLEAAEKKYQQCLEADPNDAKAARELEYVRGLRNQRR